MLERMMADNGYPVPVVENDGCRVFRSMTKQERGP